ncbi:MAG: glycerophosphodiester phosphodiesterase family protein [Verrucomicrobiales bacterium]|nr:glycerophosphodiester phosphodiesterase family protein [Verrucomicrobiales bacterium]
MKVKTPIPVFVFLAGIFSMNANADPMIMAHRGASAAAPENTLSSIKLAIEMGAKVIEFDVRETSDGALVLFHDAELPRLTGEKGTIESLNLEQVDALDVGSWFGGGDFSGEKIPSFQAAVEVCLENGVTPLIEHKTGAAANYMAVLESLEVIDSVIVQSFNWTFLHEMKKLSPDLKIGALGSKELSPEKRAQIEALNPDWVVWKFSDLSEEVFTSLKEEGFLVGLWTVNEKAEVSKWLARGIDGIITDYPDKMLKLTD